MSRICAFGIRIGKYKEINIKKKLISYEISCGEVKYSKSSRIFVQIDI